MLGSARAIGLVLVLALVLVAGDAWAQPASNGPSLVGTYAAGNAGNTRGTASGHWAYVVQARAGEPQSDLVVVDLSEPTRPTRVGSLPLPSQAVWALAAVAGRVLATTGEGGPDVSTLWIADTSIPTSPRWLGSLALGQGIVADVAIQGDRAYVLQSKRGLLVVDVADPARPRLLSALAGDTNQPQGDLLAGAVAISGDRVYRLVSYSSFRGGQPALEVVDVADPVAPRLLSSYDPTSDYGLATDVAVVDSRVYLALGLTSNRYPSRGGLQVVDVADAARPTKLGELADFGYARHVVVLPNRAYLTSEVSYVSPAQYRDELVAVDVSDPTRPVRVGAAARAWTPTQMTAACGLLILAAVEPSQGQLPAVQLEIYQPTTGGTPVPAAGGTRRVLIPAIFRGC